jgi:hypothetical protein
MAIDVQTLAQQMLAAALPILSKSATDARTFAEVEFTKIALTIRSVGEQVAAGQLSAEQARLLLDMQTQASKNVLLTLEGLALLGAEAAMNAALGAVKTAVNTAVGFALIA